MVLLNPATYHENTTLDSWMCESIGPDQFDCGMGLSRTHMRCNCNASHTIVENDLVD